MGDFVPKWNFDQKSIQNPTPNWMTLQSDVKIKNIFKFTWIYHNTILKILIKSVPDVKKATPSTFLKTSESEESIEHNIVLLKQRFHPRFVKIFFFCEFWSNIADIPDVPKRVSWKIAVKTEHPVFWLLAVGGPVDLITNLSSEFLLGTEIAHYKEENESLVTSIWWKTVLVMGYYKTRRKVL